MTTKLNTSEKLSFVAAALGVAAGTGLWWLLPDIHWGWYVGAGAIVMGSAYGTLLETTAHEKIANGDLDR